MRWIQGVRIRSGLRFLATAFAGGLFLLGMPGLAAAQSTCSKLGTVPINSGQSIYQQDEFNSSSTQCAIVSGTGFTLTTAGFNLPTTGAPAAYPSIFQGCHWGTCTSSNPFPIEESDIAAASTSVSITQPSGYNNDAAYDIWFNQTSTTSGQPDGTEIMIWINHQGSPLPFGTQTGTVTIDGTSWAVWTGRQSSWNIVSYVRVTPVTSVSNLNLLPFFSDAVARRSLETSWWLIDVEYGFEIWTGGQGLGISGFSVSAAAGNGDGGPSSSQDLGSVAVNSTTNLSFQISGLSSTPSSFGLQYGTEFSLGTPSCTTGSSITCTVGVSFHPRYPGVRQDAVQVKDSGGVLLTTTLLHGIGLAPQAVIRPGVMTNFAGTGVLGTSGDNGLAVNAKLENPQGVAVDGAGNVYIADSLAQVVRKVNTSGVITTAAGSVNNSAILNAPLGVAVDGAGNLYIADSQNNRIQRVDALSGVMTTVLFTGDSLYNPADVAVDPAGNLYIADEYNNCIRRIDAVTGAISIVAGGGTPGSGTDGLGNGGPAVNAILNDPSGVALDAAGNLYIADSGDNLIREVSDGIISVVAGSGSPGSSGDGGPALKASLNWPASVRVDAAGNLYIADSHNNAIRKVNAAGIIFTVASQLSNPGGVELDPSGNIYIADQGNSVVRKIASGPAALSFSSTAVGQINPALKTVSVDNIGNQELTFSGFSISGNFLQQSSGNADCALDVTLQAASSCSVTLAFAPQTAGPLTGGLSLLTNSLSQSANVALSGAGTGSVSAEPTVNVTSLSFPSQAAGTGSSASKTVTLTNPGSTTLTVMVSLSSSNLQDFSYTTTCQNIAAQGSCSVSLVFTPHAAGPKSATLNLTETNTTGGASFSQSVFLQGVATQPLLTVTPSITFGSQAVRTTSAAQTVTLANASSMNLAILGAALSGPSDFAISSNTCGSVLNAGGSCTVALTFSPASAGLEQASLEFSDQAGNSPQTVPIQGTGVVPVLQPVGGLTVANIGEAALGGSATLQVAFSNASQASYSISSLAIGGANATEFTAISGCGSAVAAGASCMVSVTFAPTGIGNRAASLTIAGASFETSVTVALTGIAIAQTTFDGARSGDIRASGDFDGDGISDYAVWRPSNGTWYVALSSRPGSLIRQAWGTLGDIPVPGDYDGDGKTDFAIWRPSTGTWHILTANMVIMKLAWGTLGDIPVPGDYDGDGKTDFAIWRPSTGTWHILTANYSIVKAAWGTLGDIPR